MNVQWMMRCSGVATCESCSSTAAQRIFYGLDDRWPSPRTAPQVPSLQACAAASRLKTMVLQEPMGQRVTSAQAARVLASLAGLPALEVLHFNVRWLEWSHDVVAALQVLQRARPQLAPLALDPPAAPWGNVWALFEF